MRVSARVENALGEHRATLTTNDASHDLAIAPRASGYGSSANGGELLFLALATCYCNDIYREAAKRGIDVERVEVDVDGTFGAEGEPAMDVTYRAKVAARATEEEISDLMRHTDTVAEIRNSLRSRIPVALEGIEVVSIDA